MGIFRKKEKDEYWFVPNSSDSVYGLQTVSKDTAKPKKSEAKKATTEKKATASSAKKVSPDKAKSKTAIKKVAEKPAAKATASKAAVTKSAVKSTTAKKTSTKNAASTASSKSATKPTVKKAAAPDAKATVKGKATASAAKKDTKSKSSKNSNIVTLISKEEIPKALYYDEAESEKLAKDASGEKIEVSGFPGMFEIKKSRDNRYVFNLYAANHVIIATSQIYSSSKNAQVGINSVIANAERASIEDQTLKKPTTVPFPKWEIYIDKGDEYRFRLCASNGSCICHSQGYTTKSACKNGIESIIRTVKNAKIDKSYLK